MSDHEFEKQVRQKLDDLRLKPSVGSWQKIEDRIRKVGRRPAAVYWMPLLLLMLGAGGYFYFSSSSSEEKENSLVQKEKQLPGKRDFSDKTNENDLSGKDGLANKNDVAKNDNLSNKANLPGKNDPAGKSGLSGNNNFSNNNDPSNKTPHSLKTKTFSNNKKFAAPPPINSDIESGTNIKPNTLSPNITLNAGNLSYFSKLQRPTGTSLKKPLSKELFDMDNQLNLSPAVSLKQKNISKKWAIGIRASAGISGVTEGNFIDINRATVEDVAYRASFAPSNSLVNRAAPQYTPSRLTPGFSFSAGVTFQRQLSPKVSLNTGLNYLQLNTKNKVGVKVYGNQVVNNGLRGYLNVYNYYMLEEDRPTDYMNSYHYLELPVSVSIGLNRSRRLPVFLDAGVAYSRLLGSNSLHFDGTTGVYYKNDRLLNDNQFAFTAGFAFKLFNRTKYPLLLGPSARYNVTRTLQKDVPGNKSFMTAGIDMKLFIW